MSLLPKIVGLVHTTRRVRGFDQYGSPLAGSMYLTRIFFALATTTQRAK